MSPVQICKTFIEVLLKLSQTQSHQTLYTFVQEKDHSDFSLTYGELFEQSTGLASLLQEHHLQGETVLLAFKSNYEFVIAFFACLMAGAIAVPTAVPRRDSFNYRSRIEA